MSSERRGRGAVGDLSNAAIRSMPFEGSDRESESVMDMSFSSNERSLSVERLGG